MLKRLALIVTLLGIVPAVLADQPHLRPAAVTVALGEFKLDPLLGAKVVAAAKAVAPEQPHRWAKARKVILGVYVALVIGVGALCADYYFNNGAITRFVSGGWGESFATAMKTVDAREATMRACDRALAACDKPRHEGFTQIKEIWDSWCHVTGPLDVRPLETASTAVERRLNCTNDVIKACNWRYEAGDCPQVAAF